MNVERRQIDKRTCSCNIKKFHFFFLLKGACLGPITWCNFISIRICYVCSVISFFFHHHSTSIFQISFYFVLFCLCRIYLRDTSTLYPIAAIKMFHFIIPRSSSKFALKAIVAHLLS